MLNPGEDQQVSATSRGLQVPLGRVIPTECRMGDGSVLRVLFMNPRETGLLAVRVCVCTPACWLSAAGIFSEAGSLAEFPLRLPSSG